MFLKSWESGSSSVPDSNVSQNDALDEMFHKSGESDYKSSLETDAPNEVLDDLYHKSFKTGYKSNLEFGSLKDQWSPSEIEAFKHMERDNLKEVKRATPSFIRKNKAVHYGQSMALAKHHLNNDDDHEKILAFEKETKLLFEREISKRLREFAVNAVNIKTNRSKRRRRKFTE